MLLLTVCTQISGIGGVTLEQILSEERVGGTYAAKGDLLSNMNADTFYIQDD
jgi:hypothetical protein